MPTEARDARARVFRSTRAFLAYLVVQAIFLCGATLLLWRSAGWDWLTIAMAAFTVAIGGGSLAEAVRTRVELEPEALRIRTLWGQRRIPRGELRTVRAERGAPPAVQLTDGTWVRLPSLGKHVARALREWLEGPPSMRGGDGGGL